MEKNFSMKINGTQRELIAGIRQWLETYPIGTEWVFGDPANNKVGSREFFLELLDRIETEGEYGPMDRPWLMVITYQWKQNVV